jgi:hypothetical protein
MLFVRIKNRREKLKYTNPGHIIRFEPEHTTEGFYLILNTGQAGCLPNNTYIVGEHHIEALKKADIPFQVNEKTDQ